MLELRNLSAGYAGEEKIRGISLCFEPGRIYAVVGKNGCGKSTLLKACAGLLEPLGGEALLCGRRIADYPDRERALKISYLAQMRSAPGITAERMVEHGCYPRLSRPRKLNGADCAAVQRAMERLDVLSLRKKSMKELSGGECQRVYLAMQLAQNADLMLLDEPTTYMDVEYQLLLMELLRQLREEGKCVVMVLHDLQQALKYSDEIVAMDGGCVSATATPVEALSSRILEKIFNVRIRSVGDGLVFEPKNSADR